MTMRIYEGLDAVTAPLEASTVAIGTFDGVHVGHQAIIRTAVEDARRHNRPAVVFTFDRHPLELLVPERAPAYLTTPKQRNRFMSELGVDTLVVARFDIPLSQTLPELFVGGVLKGTLNAQAIVVGTNFYFGRDRAGSADYLQSVQTKFRFTLDALDPVLVGDKPASSTRVREALRSGDIREAETVLGHSYQLAGIVVHGQKLGRTLGYPTANLELSYRQVVPADGIYAAQATLENGRIVSGACSIGERPTIEGAGRSIETFLLDFNDDIYGQRMELRFVERLRGEEKFGSLDALKTQMAKDVAEARKILESI